MESLVLFKKLDKKLIIEISPKPKRVIKFGILFFYAGPFALFVCIGAYFFWSGLFLSKGLQDLLILLGLMSTSIILIIFFLKRLF